MSFSIASDRRQDRDQLPGFFDQHRNPVIACQLRRSDDPQPVMAFTHLAQCASDQRKKLRSTPASVCFLEMGTGRRRRRDQLRPDLGARRVEPIARERSNNVAREHERSDADFVRLAMGRIHATATDCHENHTRTFCTFFISYFLFFISNEPRGWSATYPGGIGRR